MHAHGCHYPFKETGLRRQKKIKYMEEKSKGPREKFQFNTTFDLAVILKVWFPDPQYQLTWVGT